jgi:hypothetical protein
LFFPDLEEGEQQIRLSRAQPKPVYPDMAPRLRRREGVAKQVLAPRGKTKPQLTFAPIVLRQLLPKSRTRRDLRIQALPRTTYSISRSPDSFFGSLLAGNGAELQSLELELPFGVPQFVNVATLKAMLGAEADDTLFRKSGVRWEPCEDSHQVDLKDRTRLFRLGKVQIYS